MARNGRYDNGNHVVVLFVAGTRKRSPKRYKCFGFGYTGDSRRNASCRWNASLARHFISWRRPGLDSRSNRFWFRASDDNLGGFSATERRATKHDATGRSASRRAAKCCGGQFLSKACDCIQTGLEGNGTERACASLSGRPCSCEWPSFSFLHMANRRHGSDWLSVDTVRTVDAGDLER